MSSKEHKERVAVDGLSLGIWLRKHRQRLGFTQEEVAERAGIGGKAPAQQWSSYERGVVSPRRSMVIALAA